MKKTLLFIIALIALTTSCEPVTYEPFGCLAGTVVDDSDSGNTIQQATVTLSPTGRNIYTGNDGYFEFCNLNPTQYTVTVTKTGYVTNRKTVFVHAAEVTNIIVPLKKNN